MHAFSAIDLVCCKLLYYSNTDFFANAFPQGLVCGKHKVCLDITFINTLLTML